MTASEETDLNMVDATDLKSALDARLHPFNFEKGVLLVQVPQLPLDILETETARGGGYFAYPPQNLLYLAAIFRGQSVEFLI